MSVPLAWRNLIHEQSKLILSMMGVAVALKLIVLLIGFRDGMYASLTAYYDHLPADLVVAQSDTTLAGTIPATIHDKLAAISGAVATEHGIAAGVIFTHRSVKIAITLVGYNPQTGIGGPWAMAQGRGIQADDEIVLDAQLARESQLALGDNVDLLGQSFTVVGLSRETNSWVGYTVFVARTAAERLLRFSGTTSFYTLRLPTGADKAAIAHAIETQIAGVKVASPALIAANARKSVGLLLDGALNALLLVSVVIGIAVMGLTAYTAVIDRTRDYGVLKALGADSSQLARLVVRETLYRAVLGFFLGIALSYVIEDLLTRIVPRWSVLIRPETLVSTAAAALVMTIIAALLPIRRIAAIDPAVIFKA